MVSYYLIADLKIRTRLNIDKLESTSHSHYNFRFQYFYTRRNIQVNLTLFSRQLDSLFHYSCGVVRVETTENHRRSMLVLLIRMTEKNNVKYVIFGL